MNEEIREILNEFENLFEISEAPENIIKDFNMIKDYIDNLQQENKQLKEKINGVYEERDYLYNKTSIESKYAIEELQNRIEKARNKIDAMFNNGDEYTIIDDLIEIDKILKGGDKE